MGSITEYLFAPENSSAMIEKLASEQTKLITLITTEGGYNYDEATGKFNMENPLIHYNLSHPKAPKTVFGDLKSSERFVTTFTEAYHKVVQVSTKHAIIEINKP
ncbi:MAG: hypothetical protein ABJN84_08990 [Flavobacteriaceae bacterium]